MKHATGTRNKHNRILTKSQTQKDLPVQLLNSATPLEAKIVLGSFGSSKAIVASVFDINIVRDPSASNTYEAPLRYGKRPEIHHIFRGDPKNPPKIISLAFAAAVLAAIPVLFISVSLKTCSRELQMPLFLLTKAPSR